MKPTHLRRLTLTGVFLIPLLIAACASNNDRDIAASCAAAGGKWLADSRECGTGDRKWCDAHAGKFNPCASPCRNSSQRICPTVCVPVCKLPGK